MTTRQRRSLLVVEADPLRRTALTEALVAPDRDVTSVGTAHAASAASTARRPAAVVVGATREEDRELLDQLRFGAAGEVIDATADLAAIRAQIAAILARAGHEEDTGSLVPEPPTAATIVATHPSMTTLLRKATQAGHSDATVLIEGETGTGKAEIAAFIHAHSRHRARPLVRVNCAVLAPTLIESELFGHEKGAFTGAVARRRGYFERADGTTLFLDEIGEIPPDVQVKLLRFLQLRELERVGGNETVRVSVRIIAATNRDLALDVERGKFRRDLYYRLNVIRLEVPPLRARPSDIPALAHHFLRQAEDREDGAARTLSRDAARALLAYPWPGNVRELQNAVEHAAAVARGAQIEVADLPAAVTTRAAEAPRMLVPGITLDELERYAILRTLDAAGGSPSAAAKMLGISRRKIQYRLQQWGLDRYGQGREGHPTEPPVGPGTRRTTPPTATAARRSTGEKLRRAGP